MLKMNDFDKKRTNDLERARNSLDEGDFK